MIVIPTTKVINAMATIQSSIELADSAQRRIFIASVVFGVVAALIAASLAWLLWKANNKYQDAVTADANARIEEAKRGAADALKDAGVANEKAGKANERARKLESDNLTLRGQVVTLETAATDAKKDVAGLQKAAADAKAAQQRVETDLARQQERTAIAETKLIELQVRTAPRQFTSEQRALLIDLFRANEKGSIDITCLNGNKDSCEFAAQIAEALREGGWKVSGPLDMVAFGPSRKTPTGLFIIVQSSKAVPVRAVVLQKALERVGFTAPAEVNKDLRPDTVGLLVGAKP